MWASVLVSTSLLPIIHAPHRCGTSSYWLDSMIITQVGLRLHSSCVEKKCSKHLSLRISDTHPVFLPELWLRDGEPPDSLPQTKCFSKEPSEFHPGSSKGWTLWWASFAKATQWFPYLSGGSYRRSQEPASLARQVKAVKLILDRAVLIVFIDFLKIAFFWNNKVFVLSPPDLHFPAWLNIRYWRTTLCSSA